MRRSTILTAFALAMACSVSGCAAPLLLTAAAPAGLAAARAGTSAYSNGKLSVARYATLEETWDATHEALDRLHMEVHTERVSERRWYVMARDDNRSPDMRIQLDRRSPVMTRISIRVGFFGDPAVSNHILRHIDDSLAGIRAAQPTPRVNDRTLAEPR